MVSCTSNLRNRANKIQQKKHPLKWDLFYVSNTPSAMHTPTWLPKNFCHVSHNMAHVFIWRGRSIPRSTHTGSIAASTEMRAEGQVVGSGNVTTRGATLRDQDTILEETLMSFSTPNFLEYDDPIVVEMDGWIVCRASKQKRTQTHTPHQVSFLSTQNGP